MPSFAKPLINHSDFFPNFWIQCHIWGNNLQPRSIPVILHNDETTFCSISSTVESLWLLQHSWRETVSQLIKGLWSRAHARPLRALQLQNFIVAQLHSGNWWLMVSSIEVRCCIQKWLQFYNLHRKPWHYHEHCSVLPIKPHVCKL